MERSATKKAGMEGGIAAQIVKIRLIKSNYLFF
jgi:hypothetical protein